MGFSPNIPVFQYSIHSFISRDPLTSLRKVCSSLIGRRNCESGFNAPAIRGKSSIRACWNLPSASVSKPQDPSLKDKITAGHKPAGYHHVVVKYPWMALLVKLIALFCIFGLIAVSNTRSTSLLQ